MIFSKNGKKNNAGFTLVEMIVVLVILGILASAAVYGIAAYIDMTRYNNNQENAETIYQAAQATLNHMSENGTLEDWTKDIIGPLGVNGSGEPGIGTPDPFDPNNGEISNTTDNIFNKGYFEFFGSATDSNSLPGQSAHMRYAVTYTPGGSDDQSKCIEALVIKQDFKATDIMNGLITIEIDVEKSLDTSGNLRFSASVYSVFYDSTRSAWDNLAKNNLDTSIVPYRAEQYRRSESLVGYVMRRDGPAVVDSVYLPVDAEVKNFTLRNGETLDLTWSVEADGEPVTGKSAHLHYTFSLYDVDNSNKKFCDLVFNENAIFEGTPQLNLYKNQNGGKDLYDLLKFTDPVNPLYMPMGDPFKNGLTRSLSFNDNLGNVHDMIVLYSKETVTDQRGVQMIVYRASARTTAKIFVHEASDSSYSFDYNNEWTELNKAGQDHFYNFPLTISYEVYSSKDGRTISERLSYTLSLDSMMSKNLIEYDKDNVLQRTRLLNYSINRLMNGSSTNQLTTFTLPRNFYVSMIAENDNFGDTHSSYNGNTLAAFDMVYADRALDDPLYYVSDDNYSYRDNAAYKEAGKGYAVVNAYFGDYGEGSDGTKPHIDPSSGSSTQNSVITSFRHLYNIRMMEGHNGYDHYNYYIKNDLNWYTVDNSLGRETFHSEVVVYSILPGGQALKGHSPVQIPMPSSDPSSVVCYGDKLSVVSFPSISTFTAKSTLIGDTNFLAPYGSTEDNTSVINNLQMRAMSFYKKGDTGVFDNKLHGYGLINTNYGTIINIRANSMTLILNNTPDGSDDDREAIKNAVTSFIDTSGSSVINADEVLGFEKESPLGGLVGANKGIIGSSTETDPSKNTIRYSNCIISSMHQNGSEWRLYKVSSCGGIIGDNIGTNGTESAYGHLETTGRFASISWIDVGGIIGYSNSDISALLVVDTVNYKDIATRDYTGDRSVVLGSSDAVGGAVGFITNSHSFCQTGNGLVPGQSQASALTPSVEANGILTITENSSYAYAVDVTLDESSYVAMRSNDPPKLVRPGGIGGAVGRITGYSGILSVRVDNKGIIASAEGQDHEKHLGGAIGIINGGTVTSAYINVINNGMIGTYTGSSSYGYSRTTGGAVGQIRNVTGADGTFTISVKNNGPVFGNCSHRNTEVGVGGAVGAMTDANTNMPRYFVRSENHADITGYTQTSDDEKGRFGVGGAVGYVEYLPRGSAFYSIMDDGHDVTSSGDNAGGVIGSTEKNTDSDPGSNYTTITAALSNGTIVSAEGNNAGGAVGYEGGFHSNTKTRTIISGTVSVNALLNVGGVAGKMNSSITSGSSIELISTNASSVLNIKAAAGLGSGIVPGRNNNNAGGLVGQLSTGNAFKPSVVMPAQTGSNTVVLKIDSYDNAGGVFGKIFSKDHDIIVDNIGLCLTPGSYIHARHDNAGGAIGLLDARKNVKASISVTDTVTISNAPWINADNSNTGGVIGSSIGGMSMVSSSVSADFFYTGIGVGVADPVAIDPTILATPGSNVGGCIGSISGSPKMDENSSISLLGNIIVIHGTDCIGGVIGNSSKFTINGKVSVSCDTSNPGHMRATNLTIDGNDQVGGVFGLLSGGGSSNISSTAVIEYSPDVSSIRGRNNVGGFAGKTESGINLYCPLSYNISSSMIIGSGDNIGGIFGILDSSSLYDGASLEFAGNSSNIIGESTGGANTGNNVGGIIGYLNNSGMNGSSSLTYSAESSSISGRDNTGGLIGYSSGGRSGTTCVYKYAGTECTITGRNNTGGIIGTSNAYAHCAKITFAPLVKCSVTGEENVGGCAGLVDGSHKDGNLPKQPVIDLDDCKVDIKGSGYTGGMIGCSRNGAWYSGGYIYLDDNSLLFIQSGNSIAGGNIGYMTGGNLGNGTYFKIECTDRSSIQVNGATAAGGIIGKVENNPNADGNTPHISLFRVDSTSKFNITSSDAAGGIIGINASKFVRTNEAISIGRINVSAPCAGALVGRNLHTFNGSTYTITATVNDDDSTPANTAEAMELLFGEVNIDQISKFSFYLNGSGALTTK